MSTTQKQLSDRLKNMKAIKTDQHFIQQAMKLAAKAAAQGEVPVGAVVVLDNKIIGQGWNQPIVANDPTAHAEIMALRDAASKLANYRLPSATLYVTIEPCSMCAGAIIHARIARVVYGATEPKSGVAESNGCLFNAKHFNHQVELHGGVLVEQCSALISDFFQARREQKRSQKTGSAD